MNVVRALYILILLNDIRRQCLNVSETELKKMVRLTEWWGKVCTEWNQILLNRTWEKAGNCETPNFESRLKRTAVFKGQEGYAPIMFHPILLVVLEKHKMPVFDHVDIKSTQKNLIRARSELFIPSMIKLYSSVSQMLRQPCWTLNWANKTSA